MKKNKKPLSIGFVIAYCIAFAIFAAGFAMVLYPLIGTHEEAQQMEQTLQTFAAEAKTTETADKTPKIDPELHGKMEIYNQEIYEEGQSNLKDPFSYEQPGIDLTAYGLTENVVGTIEIPRLKLTLPIYLGATKENMKHGAVNLGETSLPIGGENTNCVLAAHRGTTKAEMFRNIQNIEVGDEIYITNLWETLTYRATEIKIIKPSDIKEVLIQPGRDLLTLITCHPYLHNYQRYVVYCERVTQP